jgi:hypothetical protein
LSLMNEIVKIVKTRDEFRELLKTEFIPYMIKNNLNQFIDNKDMFYKWDAFFMKIRYFI